MNPLENNQPTLPPIKKKVHNKNKKNKGVIKDNLE
jgi:hypothetical protein